nr:Ankyrin repeat domain containing protein [Hymenolepis microstoma]
MDYTMSLAELHILHSHSVIRRQSSSSHLTVPPALKLLTPLHLACMKGNLVIVKRLLDNSPNVNTVDANGETPLVKAIQCGHLGCINQLIQHGADLNIRDKYGNAPIHRAIQLGRLDIIQSLLRNCININACNNIGVTPLHIAVEKNSMPLSRYLINEGADINCVDEKGRSPLMIAAKIGSAHQLRLLINSGAIIELRDKEGFTAAQIAKSAQNFHCYELLIDRALTLASPSSKLPNQKMGIDRSRNRKMDLLNRKEVDVLEGRGDDCNDEEISDKTDKNVNFTMTSKRAHSDTRRPKATNKPNAMMRSSTTSMDRESEIKKGRLPKTQLTKGYIKSENTLDSDSLGRKGKDCVAQLKVHPQPNNVDQNAVNEEESASLCGNLNAEVPKEKNSDSIEASSVMFVEEESKYNVESSRESDCESAWSSTEEYDQPEISNEPTGNMHGNLQDSLWDSEVDDSNKLKEANEVSVTSLTQISETSGPNFSLLEDAAKALKVIAQDRLLVSSPKPVHSRTKKSSRILDNVPRQDSSSDSSIIDEGSDGTLSIISVNAQRNYIKSQENMRNVKVLASSISDFSQTKWKISENTKDPVLNQSQKSNSYKPGEAYSTPNLSVRSADNIIEIPITENQQKAMFLPSPTYTSKAGSPSQNQNNFCKTEQLLSPQLPKSHETTIIASENIDDSKEMEFLQEQLVESLKVLDREESSHRALELELNGACQQLLTSSVVHREGSSSQNTFESIFKLEQLRERLDEEKNRRLRLEGVYKSMKNQLSEKDEELFRIHSICQDMDAELQNIKMELKESETVKAKMKVEYEENIRSLKERYNKVTLDRSSSPIGEFQGYSKMALSCIRNDLIDTKAKVQFNTQEIQNNLFRFQKTILEQISSYSNHSAVENERLRNLNRDLEILNSKNNAAYEEKLIEMQDKLDGLQNMANKKDNLVKQLEEKLQDMMPILNRERETVKSLENRVSQDDDKLKQMTYEIGESRKNEKDAFKWIFCLFNHLKSLEQSTFAVHTYLNGIIRKEYVAGDIHSKCLPAEEISKLIELQGILDSVQKSAKNTMAEVTSCIPELNFVDETNFQRNESLLEKIAFPPDFDHSRNIEKYLVERILQLKDSVAPNAQLSKPQSSESIRVRVNREVQNILTESVGTMTDLDIFTNNVLPASAGVAFTKNFSPAASFEHNCINSYPSGQNLLMNARYRECAELEQLREENEILRNKFNLMTKRNKLSCECVGVVQSSDASETEIGKITKRNSLKRSCCCRKELHNVEGSPRCEHLQRRIHDLEAERNRILLEKQVLEEDVRAEHRLAEKLLSQSLQKRRFSRRLSHRHMSARKIKYVESTSESSNTSENSMEVSCSKGKVNKSRSKAVKKSDFGVDDRSAGNQRNSGSTIRSNTYAASKDTCTDRTPSRDYISSKSHNPTSATSLLLQKARMNLQAVERNLHTTSAAPSVNSPEYLEYLKNKYLI